jgi:hypothetical protein
VADVIALHNGDILETHDSAACAGGRCCIHNPSQHALDQAPLNWRSDRRIMERICPHGIGHPDPDDVKVRSDRWESVHGCDGCCRGAGGP